MKSYVAGLAAAAVVATLVTFSGVAPMEPAAAATNLQVHFIDVGQADSFLIQLPNGQNMVVDGGNNADGTAVVNFIKSKGISHLDYVVGTHPHEDHIGGLDNVINSFGVTKVYMPNATSTTQTYNDVITAIRNKGLSVTTARAGVTLFNTTANGLTLKAVMVAPNSSSYSNLNEYSAVIRLTYGSTNFLLTGDAEGVSENEMLNSGQTISANILKVGHHGSRTSSSAAFLDRVKPSAAVITVGLNNDYGHPHQETIDRLKARGIKIYRTDLQGTLTFTTTGSGWLVNKSPWWQ